MVLIFKFHTPKRRSNCTIDPSFIMISTVYDDKNLNLQFISRKIICLAIFNSVCKYYLKLMMLFELNQVKAMFNGWKA